MSTAERDLLSERAWAHRVLTREAFLAEARAAYGAGVHAWEFVCPSCLTVASLGDFTRLGAGVGALGRECIGVYEPDGSCRYTAGGLISGPWEVSMPSDPDGGGLVVVPMLPLATVLRTPRSGRTSSSG